ncbi:histidine phosphatase family protein [Gordonia sp. zg691]|uniref:histidine phosphatase family protein n=1 Tax=Gordonia jinghuaiqii TaxID=2758710 RepID=UPI0016622F28|nr:histidine phosphatase family protein [Gordonia jinghuaiqii]MBD0859810.1 histidine phosphatase family protein [Gordonia jinghuaiqii]
MTSISTNPPSPELGDPDAPDQLSPTLHAMQVGLMVDDDHTEIILVRHAQQIRNAGESRRPGGPGLSQFGQLQAALTGRYLKEDPVSRSISAAYCSPLNRTVETASIIISHLAPGLRVTVEPMLEEVDVYSRDHGLPVPREVQEEAGEWFINTLRWDAFPNTETGEELRVRLVTAIEQIAEAHRGETVLVVSHGGAIAALFAAIVSAGPDMFFFPAHASVHRVRHRGSRFVPQSMNDVGHLRLDDKLTF